MTMQAGHGGGRSGFNRVPSDPPERPVKRDTLWRTFALYRPYRRRLSGVIASVLINAGMGIIPPLLVATLIDEAIPNGDTDQLFTIAGIMIAVTVVSGGFSLLQAHLNTGRTLGDAGPAWSVVQSPSAAACFVLCGNAYG
jgi:hypothetical protein